jgi:hypothetical protein
MAPAAIQWLEQIRYLLREDELQLGETVRIKEADHDKELIDSLWREHIFHAHKYPVRLDEIAEGEYILRWNGRPSWDRAAQFLQCVGAILKKDDIEDN